MKSVSLPSIIYDDLISSCIGSIESTDLSDRLESATVHLRNAGNLYNTCATNSNLFQTISFLGDDDDIVVGYVTKKELKNLYTAQMVPASKPSRTYYDDIKLLAPLGICPFCGFGHVKTLDHYLPKSKFPLLSIFPSNLVPCCTDCNKGKLAKVATTQGEQCLHPYFNDRIFIDDQWIIATVQHSKPAAVIYHIVHPTSWSTTNKERASNHFKEYDLASRFSVQAGSELASLRKELLIDLAAGGVKEVHKNLLKKEMAAKDLEVNSWKTAMYQALSIDQWFYQGGFILE
ncbi:TPA: HNH endonuclease [Raoultella ornithinolytica]|uniref:HNH endonuclease n=1 Tax=Raoultella ornithinolytica TaxID=54291 RepID=UPI0022A8C210|nr:HNH endonuclease signature motif containing protein [Raoultella ornithinolytica]MCZ0882688.1 HNH endonuclease signature motif containing protein [Raoultella ornithinolytica]HDH7802490.1 HNH endonuclease [Raoultella ornithinolytica]HDH7838756.1 HNH endonuclease [Raoultella ornithinolytica]HDT6555366.1 HNH endonuclease [Raoultella ornithinolytica]